MPLVTLAVAASVAASCSAGDDEAERTVTPTMATATTVAETTEPPTTTTEPPTTAALTTLPPTTTLDVEALNAQIAADYVEAHQLQEALVSNPTLDGLEERLAQIAAPGSDAYKDLKSSLRAWWSVESERSTASRTTRRSPSRRWSSSANRRTRRFVSYPAAPWSANWSTLRPKR